MYLYNLYVSDIITTLVRNTYYLEFCSSLSNHVDYANFFECD